MRTFALIVLGLVAVSAFDLAQFASLVQTGTRSNDAVESVYNLLRDLKTENLQVQVGADMQNQTNEEIGTRTVSQLTVVSNINKGNFDMAKKHSDSVAGQIKDIEAWQVWAEGRLAEIERMTESLRESRCYANALFVKSLKDHGDALNVVALLKHDLSGYIVGQPSSMIQVESLNIADKLQGYSHLFKEQAVAKFVQLTAAATQDRQKGDNIAQQVYNTLLDLETQLSSTLAFLQEQEIAAAFALAKWISDTGAEKADINQTQERKANLHEKLLTAYPAALSLQGKSNKLWKDSVLAINGAAEDLAEKREFYVQETDRRNEENAIIDTCIAVFKDQVRNMVAGTSLKK